MTTHASNMRSEWLRWLALALGLCACGPVDQVIVSVSVKNNNSDKILVEYLKVAADLNGTPVTSPVQLDKDADHVRLLLPAGSQGRLRVYVEGQSTHFSRDPCPYARGQSTVDLPGPGDYPVQVDLQDADVYTIAYCHCIGRWCQQQMDSAAAFRLWAGPASGPDETVWWSVGPGGNRQRWSGEDWSTQDLGGATTAELYTVRGKSFSEVWTGGTQGTIMHFDGSLWQQVSVPPAVAYFSVFDVMPVGDEIWAVAGLPGQPSADGWLLQWGPDDATWRRGGLRDAAVALWPSAPDDVWAAGSQLWHYDGKSWTVVDRPRPEDGILRLWGTGPKDVYAVGYRGLLLHWDGQVWTAMDSHTTELLVDVWGSGPRDVYAVGYAGTVRNFDGRSWSVIPGPGALPITSVTGSGPFDVRISHGGTIYRLHL